MRLDGKVAVITGSAANIGKATALLFASEGAKVVVTTRNNIEAAVATVAEIRQARGDAVFVAGDLTQAADVDELFLTTVKTYGRLDILVNNAGGGRTMPFADTDHDHWVQIFENNFFSVVACSLAGAKLMEKTGGGVILNTSSMRGIDNVGGRNNMAYSTAKAAVISFTKTLAKELAASSIRVNSLAPGMIITPKQRARPQEEVQPMLDASLIRRWITPDEIAEGFLYLATANAVTGENLVVDGGFSLKLE